MSLTIRKTMMAGMLAALFAGSAVAEVGTAPVAAQEHAEMKSSNQARIEQETQAQERLQQRLNEQSGQGEQARMRHEYREQRFETYREHPMQTRPMGR